jgi:uncharacterized protein YbjQ (UPF0145 family)
MKKLMYYCPKCKQAYSYDQKTPPFCDICGYTTVPLNMNVDEWHNLTPEEREAIKAAHTPEKQEDLTKEDIGTGSEMGEESNMEVLYKELAAKEDEINNNPQMLNDVMMTTGFDFQGYNITKYCGVIFNEKFVGMGLTKIVKSIVGNVVAEIKGTEAEEMSKRLQEVKCDLVKEVKTEAILRGGNALIGIDFEPSYMGEIMMISMTATAVSIEKIVE